MSAKPMTREEVEKVRAAYSTLTMAGLSPLAPLVMCLLATLDAAERRADAAEADADRLAGALFEVMHDCEMVELRDEVRAAARASLSSHAAAVERREKAVGRGSTPPSSTTPTDLAAEAVALAEAVRRVRLLQDGGKYLGLLTAPEQEALIAYDRAARGGGKGGSDG